MKKNSMEILVLWKKWYVLYININIYSYHLGRTCDFCYAMVNMLTLSVEGFEFIKPYGHKAFEHEYVLVHEKKI